MPGAVTEKTAFSFSSRAYVFTTSGPFPRMVTVSIASWPFFTVKVTDDSAPLFFMVTTAPSAQFESISAGIWQFLVTLFSMVSMPGALTEKRAVASSSMA